jgi:hypothetical protein
MNLTQRTHYNNNVHYGTKKWECYAVFSADVVAVSDNLKLFVKYFPPLCSYSCLLAVFSVYLTPLSHRLHYYTVSNGGKVRNSKECRVSRLWRITDFD